MPNPPSVYVENAQGACVAHHTMNLRDYVRLIRACGAVACVILACHEYAVVRVLSPVK